MYENKKTEQNNTTCQKSNRINGLCYEPLGLPTQRVLRLKAQYQKQEENSHVKEIVRHFITPAELLHNSNTKNIPCSCSLHKEKQTDIYKYARNKMIKEQLIARGITDTHVLSAMSIVPRHLFVNEALHNTAYDDRPLPIACGQTISQPYTVALMCQLLMLEKGMKVLEIGTGSGYQTAVLREMGAKVFSVERIPELYNNTKKLLKNQLGYTDLQLFLSDGTLGLERFAPFDRIIVAAGGPTIPQALKEQMDHNAIMLIPVGNEKMRQSLVRVFKINGSYKEENHGATTFVDLVGKQGW